MDDGRSRHYGQRRRLFQVMQLKRPTAASFTAYWPQEELISLQRAIPLDHASVLDLWCHAETHRSAGMGVGSAAAGAAVYDPLPREPGGEREQVPIHKELRFAAAAITRSQWCRSGCRCYAVGLEFMGPLVLTRLSNSSRRAEILGQTVSAGVR